MIRDYDYFISVIYGWKASITEKFLHETGWYGWLVTHPGSHARLVRACHFLPLIWLVPNKCPLSLYNLSIAIISHQSAIFWHFWDNNKGIFRKKKTSCTMWNFMKQSIVVVSPVLYISHDGLKYFKEIGQEIIYFTLLPHNSRTSSLLWGIGSYSDDKKCV